jgi:hypothetical protein
MDWQRGVLGRKLDEFIGQIRDKEAMLRENRDLPPEERRNQEFELDLMREMVAQLERRLQNIERPESRTSRTAPRRREMDEQLNNPRQEQKEIAQARVRTDRRTVEREPAVAYPRARESGVEEDTADYRELLVSRLRMLKAEAEEIESIRRSLGDGEPDRARDLEAKLDGIREAIGQTEKKLGTLEAGQQVRDDPTVQRSTVQARRRPTNDPYGDMYGAIPGGRTSQEAQPRTRERGQRSIQAEEERTTRVYKLEQAGPEQVRKVVQSLLGESGQAVTDEPGRKVIVTATFDDHLRIERIIRELDTPAGAGDLKNEVEKLRDQMNGLREQLQQMQKLLEQTAERGQTGGDEAQPSQIQEMRVTY